MGKPKAIEVKALTTFRGSFMPHWDLDPNLPVVSATLPHSCTCILSWKLKTYRKVLKNCTVSTYTPTTSVLPMLVYLLYHLPVHPIFEAFESKWQTSAHFTPENFSVQIIIRVWYLFTIISYVKCTHNNINHEHDFFFFLFQRFLNMLGFS